MPFKLSIDTNAPKEKHSSDMLAMGVFSDLKFPKWAESQKKTAEQQGFTGKLGQTFHAPALVFIGLGDEKQANVDTYRKAAAWAFKCANDKRAKTLSIALPSRKSKHLQAAAEGALLASYRFDKYISENKSETYVQNITFHADDDQFISKAETLSYSVCLARDLINECASEMTPEAMARCAQKEGKALGLEVGVLDEKALAKENMRLMLAVGRASIEAAPPRLVRIVYKPLKKSKKHIILVGKGVTFDSGGLDIKTADGMLEMKVDMSGAATVLATLVAVAKLKPDIAVTGYMACVENGISAHAYHPGDVIVSRKGLSIEINNTDAEGRLVLADALDYAQSKDKADYIVDVATLTGASMIALGTTTSSLFSTSDEMSEEIIKRGKDAGEDFWRMPLNEDLRDQLKSPLADMKNSGGRYGGAVTAALFLKKFIHDDTAWAHLDIAGPSINDKEHPYLSKGGVGFGVRTLTEWILRLALR